MLTPGYPCVHRGTHMTNLGRAMLAGIGSALVAAHAHAAIYYMSGVQRHTSFALRAGDQIIAVGDLTLACTADLTIEGCITARPGCSIHLQANTLTIRDAVIHAGAGASSIVVEGNGGNGGSIVLSAAHIALHSATLVAGDGGKGGPAGNGGNGGRIEFTGCPTLDYSRNVKLELGGGGRGGDGVAGFSSASYDGGEGGVPGDFILPDCLNAAEVPPMPMECTQDQVVRVTSERACLKSSASAAKAAGKRR